MSFSCKQFSGTCRLFEISAIQIVRQNHSSNASILTLIKVYSITERVIHIRQQSLISIYIAHESM